ncbi:MAG TPA: RNA-binding protein [Polyangiaceae bacterium]|nr:RNA-binding protein [Polyangiaceae bacterium]
MTTKLYVTNLSDLATLTSLRQFFTACGEVVDVEFLAERSFRPTSAAYVTMATGASAARAIETLHGAELHGRKVLVSVAPGAAEPRREKPKPQPLPGVRIAQQYRDRHGMFYELDSAGLRLTLKFLFPEHEGDAWRVQAAAAGEQLGSIEGCADSRERAFTALSERCAHSSVAALGGIEWLEVAVALRAVRAM